MSNIRYVCLSDLHLGEEDSLLTNLRTASTDTDPTAPSPVMVQLVECLRALILGKPSTKKAKKTTKKRTPKPTLILNGDILELALTTTEQTLMVFERFIELILPKGEQDRLFDRIVYIPGNHDHHLWESARESSYVDGVVRQHTPGTALPIPYHTTNMFEKDGSPLVRCFLLSELVARFPHLEKFEVRVAYPNYGVLSPNGRRCALFHHGHFVEPLYHLISILKTLLFPHRKMPQRVWDIEAENFAWIDFLWSTLGRSGEAGKDIELIYEKMQDRDEFKKVLYNLAAGLAERYDLPGWGDRMEARILKWIFNAVVNQMTATERHKPSSDEPGSSLRRYLSEDAEKGLRKYLDGPVWEQYTNELGGTRPADVTLVFGHTHKPFQTDMNFGRYPQWVNVYNTGGWVVETRDPEPVHGGAIVLLDEGLHATSIRMYNEPDHPGLTPVVVEEAKHPGEPASAFHEAIAARVDPDAEPWKSFAEVAATTISKRAANLSARISKKG